MTKSKSRRFIIITSIVAVAVIGILVFAFYVLRTLVPLMINGGFGILP